MEVTAQSLIRLCVSLLMMSVSGVLYAYGAFSDDLKSECNLDDEQSSRIITIGNVGFCFAAFVGMASDFGGPKLCCVIGGLISGLSFLLLTLSIQHKVQDSWWAIAMEMAGVGQGSTFLYMAALTSYQSFPKNLHGVTIGLLDCVFGFSAGIYTLIYSASGMSVSAFMVTCACSIITVSVLGCAVLKRPEHDAEDEEQAALVNDGAEKESSLSGGAGHREASRYAALKSLSYWLLFVLFMIGQGTALQLVNNAGDIATAIHPSGGSSLSTSIPLVASISGGSFRFLLGAASSAFVHKGYRVSLLLVVVMLFLVIAQVLLFFAFESAIIASAALTGMSFGGQWCVVPILTSSEFGEMSFGLNWGVLICASAVGPWIFQPYQASVYNSHTSGSGSCSGDACYHDTWLVTLISSVFAFGLTVVFDYFSKEKQSKGKMADPVLQANADFA
eukprot:TRINITY_DN2174_c0_g8_i1.p1 TRINITY_DN2174_c0_g8~~TRINITY_DN2174_c0_g8_i1.p1  ORF type:complete len:462 (+),score=95.21 TRINITY_DN2174_c0_g8_i1:49-1386(+)